MQKVGFKLAISWLPVSRPRKHGHSRFELIIAKFDKLIQLLSFSKVAKTELYSIGGYHNEWLELTYHIETLTTITTNMTTKNTSIASTNTTVEVCEPNPCNNNGKCVEYLGKYVCDCFGTKYEGDYCEIMRQACKKDEKDDKDDYEVL